jgi:hypothetical protein
VPLQRQTVYSNQIRGGASKKVRYLVGNVQYMGKCGKRGVQAYVVSGTLNGYKTESVRTFK